MCRNFHCRGSSHSFWACVSLWLWFSLDTLPAEGHQSWNPAVKCSATLTTIESVIGNKANSNGGATFSGGGFAPGIPDKRSTSPTCVYPANGNVTFVEIHHVKVGSMTDTSGSG